MRHASPGPAPKVGSPVGWRTSVSSHVGVVLKQSLIAKAVAAAVPRPTAGGPGGRHQLEPWRLRMKMTMI